MILSTRISHPAWRSYVMKLHHDADPARGHLCGRLENLATGRHMDFRSIDELLALLAGDLPNHDDAGALQ
jgi:hypothetical protein